MPINDIQAIAPYLGAASATQSKELDKGAFLQLLVQQIKSQDPLNPTSNEAFVGQLASFSALEQMQNMSEGMLGLALVQQDTAFLAQMAQGGALIGKQVEYENAETGAIESGVVQSVIVKDGQALLKIGEHEVSLGYVTKISAPDAPSSGGDAGEGGEAPGADTDGSADSGADQ